METRATLKQDFHTIIFDFDGVFTDNKVYIDDSGRESVCCSRADSYGVSQLLNYIDSSKVQIDVFVLSTETNEVVSQRCRKMGVPYHVGEANKAEFLKAWIATHRSKHEDPYRGIVYFGNDLNDLEVMSMVGLSFAPSDAHPRVREAATHVFASTGGNGFVREGLESLIELIGN